MCKTQHRTLAIYIGIGHIPDSNFRMTLKTFPSALIWVRAWLVRLQSLPLNRNYFRLKVTILWARVLHGLHRHSVRLDYIAAYGFLRSPVQPFA